MRQKNFLPFLVWLLAFYGVWLSIVVSGNYWNDIREHAGMAIAMLFGSYVAGSTPMGGGTVGFPIIVLLFDSPGALGRSFGLAIQSIGMVSASIYIFCSRQPIEKRLLRYAIVGSCVGTPLGAAWIAPFVSDTAVKLTFAVVWASFGIMHLAKLGELVELSGISRKWDNYTGPIGIGIGIVGGIVASLTGVGIDMMVYAVLVLLYRADLRIAIPTSVILMAATSVLGILSNLALARLNPALYAMDREVFLSWLAAAPVVALGAPLGSFVVSLISRTPTLVFVSLLCILQFVWTAVHEQLNLSAIALSVIAVLAVNLVFLLLARVGRSHSEPGLCDK